MSLELLDLPAAGHSLLLLHLLDGMLALERRVQKNLVSLEFHLVSLISELLLRRIVLDKLIVTLSVEHKPLIVIQMLFLLLDRPLAL